MINSGNEKSAALTRSSSERVRSTAFGGMSGKSNWGR